MKDKDTRQDRLEEASKQFNETIREKLAYQDPHIAEFLKRLRGEGEDENKEEDK